jgi:hypothetical protein
VGELFSFVGQEAMGNEGDGSAEGEKLEPGRERDFEAKRKRDLPIVTRD